MWWRLFWLLDGASLSLRADVSEGLRQRSLAGEGARALRRVIARLSADEWSAHMSAHAPPDAEGEEGLHHDEHGSCRLLPELPSVLWASGGSEGLCPGHTSH